MHQPSYSYNHIQQEKLAQTLNNALAAHKRIMAVRVDCRYPGRSGDAWLLGQIGAHSDSEISRLIASLKAKLDADLAGKQKAWGRNLRNQLHYVWVREIGPQCQKPHYHLMLFVNKDIYHGLGNYNTAGDSLSNKIREAWCSALGLPMQQFAHLVSFPSAPLLYVDANSPNYAEQVAKVLERGSYLCKTYSKQTEAGHRAFGTSRLRGATLG